MSEEAHSTNGLVQSSWIDKLKHAFTAEPKDRDQLIDILRESQKRSLFDADALAMIEGVLQVSEMQVRDIMVPRSQVVVLERDLPTETMLRVIVESGHSRFPVIGESRDEVLGILLAKDMLGIVIDDDNKNISIRDILRPSVFVPESKRLNVLLKDFRESRNHMAMVIDEYSGVAGLVTIEDVLEQIVGEIDDEHDAADVTNIRRSGFQLYSVRGLTPIDEFNQYFDSNLKHDKFETIAGLVTFSLGHLPDRGEEVTIGKFHFKVISANSRRINNMQVSLLSDSDVESSETNAADTTTESE